MTLLQSILEITDFTLEINDPHPTLFTILIDIVSYFEKGSVEPNLAFWFYECELLSEMGFRIDLTNNKINGYSFPDPDEGENSLSINVEIDHHNGLDNIAVYYVSQNDIAGF